jgi:hypothetical protein
MFSGPLVRCTLQSSKTNRLPADYLENRILLWEPGTEN